MEDKYNNIIISWLDFINDSLGVKRSRDFDNAVRHLAEEIYKHGRKDTLKSTKGGMLN